MGVIYSTINVKTTEGLQTVARDPIPSASWADRQGLRVDEDEDACEGGDYNSPARVVVSTKKTICRNTIFF